MKKTDFIALSNSRLAGQKTVDLSVFKDLNQLSKCHKEKEEVLSIIRNTDVKEVQKLMADKHIELLKNPLPHIFRPPPYVYKRGQGDLAMKKVAIIGARKATEYGKKIAYQLARDLSKYVMIVSGLAYGIDYMAHKGAVDHGGQTMAVLGSGILNCYPKGHQSLYDGIMENGLIISEYGLFSKPLKHHFPFRNRLISAFSDIIIVVEAKEKSGTMITVNYGLDQGKTIMAVPGSIFNDNCKGTHALIKSGAKLCTHVDDVLDEIITF